MTLHVHAAAGQPATRYRVSLAPDDGLDGLWIRNHRRALMRCFRCKRLRWAKNMFVQVYYDGVYQFCKEGRGCR